MTTARNIITAALRKLASTSANSVPTAEDIDIGLETLNALIDSKSTTLLNIHTIEPKRYLFASGQLNYKLGPTGDWITERPMRLEEAKLMMNPTIVSGVIVDDDRTLFIPIDIVDDSEFSSIRMRGITNALPTRILDNGGYPDRSLMFWPIPNSGAVGVELWLWEPLVIYDLDKELDLPKGYERYLTYALAAELCDTFSKQITKEIIESLIEAEAAIKTINQVDFIAQPSVAADELRKTGSPYNYIDFISGAAMLPRQRS